MNPNESDRIIFRISAAWPRPPLPVESLAVWAEHLKPLSFDAAWAAVLMLERNRSRQPALADFHEAYQASRPRNDVPALEDNDDPGLTSDEQKANVQRVRETIEGLRSNLSPFSLRMPRSRMIRKP